ncbi:hypothetical protein NDU88_005440 [Pleurodeles waltl]|uniref:Uncharacterized protein n=1 Tax=Pleurodeles waltl TaxID=8319 RepID=A0AAV7L4L0_PLEWA|nr:hypothetical protein NDU88_005440 [Pleurodeles waltl]
MGPKSGERCLIGGVSRCKGSAYDRPRRTCLVNSGHFKIRILSELSIKIHQALYRSRGMRSRGLSASLLLFNREE